MAYCSVPVIGRAGSASRHKGSSGKLVPGCVRRLSPGRRRQLPAFQFPVPLRVETQVERERGQAGKIEVGPTYMNDSPCLTVAVNVGINMGQERGLSAMVWRDGRVAEGGGLLNRYTVKSRIGGSNPPLSAIRWRNPVTDTAEFEPGRRHHGKVPLLQEASVRPVRLHSVKNGRGREAHEADPFPPSLGRGR
jgi:hypothetical protein